MSNLVKLLTPKEAADILAVSTSTLRDLVRHGEIAFVQRGRGTERRHLAFHPLEIENYIKRNTRRVTVAAPAPPVVGGTDFLAQRAARLAAKKASR